MTVTSEDLLLLQLARKKLDLANVKKVEELLGNDLDWGYIKKNSEIHEISPLLYHNLNKISIKNKVPEGIMEGLKKRYYHNLARNMLLFEELAKVIESLNKANIEVVALKGAAIALTVYQDIGLREMWDIDILIQKKNLSSAKQEILKLGYSIVPKLDDSYRRGLPIEEYYSKYYPHLPAFYKKSSGIILEVHWDLISEILPFQINIDRIWDKLIKNEISGLEIKMLSYEDLLIHQCVHIARHRFSAKLRDYCDIAELSQLPLDWKNIVETAKKNRLKTPIYFALELAGSLFGISIPEEPLKELKPGKIREKIFRSIVTEEDIINNELAKKEAAGLLLELLIIDSLREGLRFMFKKVFPPLEWLAIKHSIPKSKKLYLYYFTHMSYLTFKALTFPLILLKSRLKNKSTR
jgi:hypothetical protein